MPFSFIFIIEFWRTYVLESYNFEEFLMFIILLSGIEVHKSFIEGKYKAWFRYDRCGQTDSVLARKQEAMIPIDDVKIDG